MAAPNADHEVPEPDDGTEHPDDPAQSENQPLDVEGRWAQIVAELEDESTAMTDTATTSTARPERAVPHEPPAARRGPANTPVAPWVHAPGPRDWPASDDVEALEDEQSHFFPPDVPPISGRSPLLTLAWLLVMVSAVVFLVTAIFMRPFPTAIAQACSVAFVVGVGLLIWRLPARRDPDSSDPGAIV